MKAYTKPTAEKIRFTYETQVVAASTPDSECYTVSAYIHQRPQTGRGDYRLQINAQHHATHTCTAQTLYLTFNQPVTYKSCNGNGAALVSGNGTSVLTVSLTYYNNPNDNIGIGDFVVESEQGLEVIGYTMTDNG